MKNVSIVNLNNMEALLVMNVDMMEIILSAKIAYQMNYFMNMVKPVMKLIMIITIIIVKILEINFI